MVTSQPRSKGDPAAPMERPRPLPRVPTRCRLPSVVIRVRPLRVLHPRLLRGLPRRGLSRARKSRQLSSARAPTACLAREAVTSGLDSPTDSRRAQDDDVPPRAPPRPAHESAHARLYQADRVRPRALSVSVKGLGPQDAAVRSSHTPHTACPPTGSSLCDPSPRTPPPELRRTLFPTLHLHASFSRCYLCL